MYRIIGYYICELIKNPQCLSRKGTMLSVSDCFGGTHPRLDICLFINDYIKTEERDEYKRIWNLNEERAEKLINEISDLLGENLAVDGRFSRLSDACHFYDSYFNKENCVIVSVSTKDRYFEVLKDELMNNSGGSHFTVTDCVDKNALLGFDILGWDISGFHSFLCNGLQEMLPEARFNKYGLLENTFDEVAAFSAKMQGNGEPVEWVPCRIGKVHNSNVF